MADEVKVEKRDGYEEEEMDLMEHGYRLVEELEESDVESIYDPADDEDVNTTEPVCYSSRPDDLPKKSNEPPEKLSYFTSSTDNWVCRTDFLANQGAAIDYLNLTATFASCRDLALPFEVVQKSSKVSRRVASTKRAIIPPKSFQVIEVKYKPLPTNDVNGSPRDYRFHACVGDEIDHVLNAGNKKAFHHEFEIDMEVEAILDGTDEKAIALYQALLNDPTNPKPKPKKKVRFYLLNRSCAKPLSNFSLKTSTDSSSLSTSTATKKTYIDEDEKEVPPDEVPRPPPTQAKGSCRKV
ncbi:hypothetical protein B0T24DRAFT_718266 [Lasiosphaeria ovina]|uniref:Uncharacterized protein n=1 Tax=Lasiosphaeria ovina TaxID=92902 RepID=A0AAE0N9I1_9PEZI|nr:hypothetical protein B0T24DRAFT_718266 [Lasiosphaeria ovina]